MIQVVKNTHKANGNYTAKNHQSPKITTETRFVAFPLFYVETGIRRKGSVRMRGESTEEIKEAGA